MIVRLGVSDGDKIQTLSVFLDRNLGIEDFKGSMKDLSACKKIADTNDGE